MAKLKVGKVLESSQDWSKRAKCKKEGISPEFFFPTNVACRSPEVQNRDELEAERALYCLGQSDGPECQVRSECLSFALETRQSGVWGGTTEEERVRIRRRQARLNKKSA